MKMKPIIWTIVFLIAVGSPAIAASHKPFLNLLGEAMAYREFARLYIDRCANEPSRSIRLGTENQTLDWNASSAMRVARDLQRRTDACIVQMLPKAYENGWMTNSEWEQGLRISEQNFEETHVYFKESAKTAGTAEPDLSVAVCLMMKENIWDIAKDDFC
jgi:hypothetical protein